MNGTLTTSLNRMNNRSNYDYDRPPFSITLAGQKHYVVTSPSDVTAVYKTSSTLTMEMFLRDLMFSFDVSAYGTDRSFETLPKAESNPNGKSLCEVAVIYYRHQLFASGILGETVAQMIPLFDNHVSWQGVKRSSALKELASLDKYAKVSLLRWCQETVLDVAVRKIFGNGLVDMNPTLLDDFIRFDTLSWKLLYRFPKIFRKEVDAARDKIVDMVGTYLDLPEEQRPDTSFMVRADIAEQKRAGLPKKDMMKHMTLLLWA